MTHSTLTYKVISNKLDVSSWTIEVVSYKSGKMLVRRTIDKQIPGLGQKIKAARKKCSRPLTELACNTPRAEATGL